MKKLDWRHWASFIFVLVVPFTILYLFTTYHPVVATMLWLSFCGFICASFCK